MFRIISEVASFTDAWIETIISGNKIHIILVASFTDAWIETKRRYRCRISVQSHLLQMRGLKQQQIKEEQDKKKVASFTDAWIETEPESISQNNIIVASFTDAWIETRQRYSGHHSRYRRIFYRCVD